MGYAANVQCMDFKYITVKSSRKSDLLNAGILPHKIDMQVVWSKLYVKGRIQNVSKRTYVATVAYFDLDVIDGKTVDLVGIDGKNLSETKDEWKLRAPNAIVSIQYHYSQD